MEEKQIMAKHTAGKLRVSLDSRLIADVPNDSGGDDHIPMAVASVNVLVEQSSHPDAGSWRANAKRIVLCWNSHDTLVKALEDVLSWDYKTEGCADPDCGVCKRSKKIEKRAKQALKQVEGE